MDFSVPEDIERALLGLAVLAAIPAVLFALWAEYYGRYLAAARKSSPAYDPKLEKERIRITAACVLLFEFILFIGSLDLVQAFPKTCAMIILVCVFAVGATQAGVEKILIPSQLTPTPANATLAKTASNGSKALLSGLVSGFLYVMTLMVFVNASAWIASHFHFSNAWGAGFVMLGAAIGIVCGLTLNFALAPWQMKNALSVTAMTPEEEASASGPMKKAGLNEFEYWVIEGQNGAVAATAGFSWGRGLFRPALFVSRTTMTSLTKGEIEAVVAHEAAHVLAKHLRKRVLLSAGLVICLTFMAGFCTIAAFTMKSDNAFQGSIGMICGVVGFALAFFILQKQNRVHEFQADWLGIQKLGADFESWASALRKMDKLNGYPVLPGALSSHPRTELRIQNVTKMIEFFGVLKKAEAAKPDSDQKDQAA